MNIYTALIKVLGAKYIVLVANVTLMTNYSVETMKGLKSLISSAYSVRNNFRILGNKWSVNLLINKWAN